MNTSPITDALRRQQSRREGGIPTIGALAGPTGLGVRVWRGWAEADRRPCVVAHDANPIQFLEVWVGAAFAVADPADRACRWVAEITARDTESVARDVQRMTRHDLEVLWRTLPTDPHAPAASAAIVFLTDSALGRSANSLRFVREFAVSANGATRVVRAITGLYPPESWPALLLVPPAGHATSAVRALELIASAEPRLPVAVALATEEYADLVARHPDSRAAALIREGFVEVRGITGNELEERLRATGSDAPVATVNRLVTEGLAPEVADAFVEAARTVRDPTPAELASDFRSVHEQFLFELLESVPQTAGLFRPNCSLEFRHGNQPAEADLLADTLKLVIEVDGAHFHLNPEQYRRDRRKDWLYQRHGYLVLRFLAEDVVSDLELVLNTILEAVALRRAATHPTGAA